VRPVLCGLNVNQMLLTILVFGTIGAITGFWIGVAVIASYHPEVVHDVLSRIFP
jgi:hypothetical protein